MELQPRQEISYIVWGVRSGGRGGVVFVLEWTKIIKFRSAPCQGPGFKVVDMKMRIIETVELLL